MKSSLVTDRGPVPVAKSVLVPKLPVPVPRRIETLLELKFATARSGRPSALKSPLVTDVGLVPVGKSVWVPKLPVPVPSLIDRLRDI